MSKFQPTMRFEIYPEINVNGKDGSENTLTEFALVGDRGFVHMTTFGAHGNDDDVKFQVYELDGVDAAAFRNAKVQSTRLEALAEHVAKMRDEGFDPQRLTTIKGDAVNGFDLTMATLTDTTAEARGPRVTAENTITPSFKAF